MKNPDKMNTEALIDVFRKKEMIRSAPSERISAEPENPHDRHLEHQRLLMEFRQYRDQLEFLKKKLSRRSRELEEENKKLKLANRELEALNYTVTHDLRTPLT